MGNTQGKTSEPVKDEMQQLSQVVQSPKFKEMQIKFFNQYCKEFSEEDENKLQYTQIHNEYEQMVEKIMLEELGQETLVKIQNGLPQYLKQDKESMTKEVYEAIEVLSSLGDFSDFKATMIAKKRELDGSQQATGNLKIGTKVVSLEIPEIYARIEALKNVSNEGWTQMVDRPQAAMWSKKSEAGDTIMRCTLELDLSSDHALAMFLANDPESVKWRDGVSEITVIKDWGPNDSVSRWKAEVPWAVKYMMSLPDYWNLRIISKKDDPEEGTHQYAIIPYDIEKNINLESDGVMKLKTGIIQRHPDDKNKCIVTSLDSMTLSYVPNFALKSLMSKSIDKISNQVKEFKKSQMYEQLNQ